MPKYRKLHTKIVDSLDFTEMPDDFTRVTWLLLIVIVDSAGRGIYNASWIRSKMFPLREDVDPSKIIKSFEWFQEKGMINIYQVDNRSYFEVKSFKDYQTGLEKEANSLLPASQELLHTNSEVNSEKVMLAVSAPVSEYESESDGNEISQMQRWLEEVTGIPGGPRAVQSMNEFVELGCTKDDIQSGYDWYKKNVGTVKYWSSLVGPTRTEMAKRLNPPPREYSNGGGRRFEAEHPPLDIDNSIEVAPRV